MEPEVHLFVSVALAAVVYLITDNIPAAVGSFVCGFLIDIDHVLEYWMYKRKIHLRGEFFTNYSKRSGKLYIFLHSYELLAAIIAIAILTETWVFWGIGLGMALHLLMDLIGNNVKLVTFSLIYRIANDFRSDAMFKK